MFYNETPTSIQYHLKDTTKCSDMTAIIENPKTLKKLLSKPRLTLFKLSITIHKLRNSSEMSYSTSPFTAVVAHAIKILLIRVSSNSFHSKHSAFTKFESNNWESALPRILTVLRNCTGKKRSPNGSNCNTHHFSAVQFVESIIFIIV